MPFRSHRITTINDPYFKEMWELYSASFPLTEIRDYEDTEKALTDNLFHCTVYLSDENKVSAFFHSWDLPSFYYVETLAVHPDFRGHGTGTSLMHDFIEEEVLPSHKPFLLEIETVCDDYTAKRWRFYERLGFKQYDSAVYLHPSYRKNCSSFNTTVLSYNHELSDNEFNVFTQVEKKIPLCYSYNKGIRSE